VTAYDAQWRAVRLQVLARDGQVCQLGLPGCTRRAEHVDHIVPLSEGGARLDPVNLRASCAACNQRRNRERQTELARFARSGSASRSPSREW
jgi:5-methylcytosine-specific restriction endonuclease McrA